MKNEIVFVMPSLVGGGAERVALSLATFFINRNYKFIFLLTKSKKTEYVIPNGVKVVGSVDGRSMRPLRQISLIRMCMREHPQATFISFLPHQNMYTLIASSGLSNKVVISVRNDPRFDFPRNKILPIIRNFLYQRANSIVFQTNEQMGLFPINIQEKGRVIFNPIPENIPSPFEGERRKVIVTSGRLEEQKNHAMTIRAFAIFHKRHPDYVLEVFGSGSLEEELKQLVIGLGIEDSVLFKGFSPDVLRHVRTAAVFVMSSRFEGLSNSMLEALCMGVPTICTRCKGGGAEAVIESNVNGILVNIDDIEAEARAMDRLVSCPQEAQAMGTRACKLRSNLSLESIGKKWLLVVE